MKKLNLKIEKPGKFISKSVFREYLKVAVKRKETYTCTTTNCPLARATGYAVDSYSYACYEELLDIYLGDLESMFTGTLKRLPEWAAHFVDVFDNVTNPSWSGYKPLPKNANTALEVLDGKFKLGDNGWVRK